MCLARGGWSREVEVMVFVRMRSGLSLFWMNPIVFCLIIPLEFSTDPAGMQRKSVGYVLFIVPTKVPFTVNGF